MEQPQEMMHTFIDFLPIKMQIYTQKIDVQPVSMKEAHLERWYLKGGS